MESRHTYNVLSIRPLRLLAPTHAKAVRNCARIGDMASKLAAFRGCVGQQDGFPLQIRVRGG